MSGPLSPLQPFRFGSSRVAVPARPGAPRASVLGKRPRGSLGLGALQLSGGTSCDDCEPQDVEPASRKSEGATAATGEDSDGSPDEDQPPIPGGRRRRTKRKSSRIARPRDSMPGFRKRPRGFRPSVGSAGHRAMSSGTTAIGKKYLNRGLSVTSYYGKQTINDADGDGESQILLGGATELVEYFERKLADSNSPAGDHGPTCLNHGLQCEKHQVKKRGPNKGRFFYKCALPERYKQCAFFMWEDDFLAQDEVEHESSGEPSVTADPIVRLDHGISEGTKIGGDPVTDLPTSSTKLEKQLRDVLREVFGFEAFRPGQLPVILSLLRKQSALALMPTGGGKSLIFQMYAAVQPGMVVVVAPLVSLIVDHLAALPDEIPGACLRSGQGFSTVLAVERSIRNGEVKVLFVTPERLFTERFQNLVRSLPDNGVSLVVIDEAHCISEMGHNFRTSYLRLERALFGRPRSQDELARFMPAPPWPGDSAFLFKRPPVLALTATATKDVTQDICRSLHIDENNSTRVGLERENLAITVSRVDGAFDSRARELVRRLQSEPFSTYVLQFDDHAEVRPSQGHASETDVLPGDLKSGSRKGPPSGNKPNKIKRGKEGCAQMSPFRGIVLVYVSKQRECESLCNYLRSSRLRFIGSVQGYHAGMTSAARANVQKEFDKGRVSVLVATIAFGMGLNCLSVRGVIHFDVPFSVEAYSQEVGRAGRDGRRAFCHLLMNEYDAQRLRSRAHSDGIDLSTVRAFLRRLLYAPDRVSEGSDVCDASSEDEGARRASTSEQVVAGASMHDELPAASDLRRYEKESSLNHSRSSSLVVFSHRVIERELDMRCETAETICTYVEGLVPGFTLEASRPGILSIRFFSGSHTQLAEDDGVSRSTADTVARMMKFAKNRNGVHEISLYEPGRESSARPSADAMLRAARALKAQRHADFELSGEILMATTPCRLMGDRELVDKLACTCHSRLAHIERTRRSKADYLFNILTEAERMLSDEEQSRFLHGSLMEYYRSGVRCDENRVHGSCRESMKDSVTPPGALQEEQVAGIAKATRHVLDATGYGMRPVTTPRQVARILHGIQSAAYTAKDWCRCPHWGKFVHVDFLTVKLLAANEIRERTLLRPV